MVKNEIYSFYRQGETYTINADCLEKYTYDRVFEGDLGQIVLVN